MFEKARSWLAQQIAPPAAAPARRISKRMYAGAAFNRLTMDWIAPSSAADTEIHTSLRPLRNRARELERDNDYAKNVVRLFKNNVVGQGIAFQSQVMMRRGGKLDEPTNTAIEKAWKRWCRKEFCSVNGRLSFTAIQRMAVAAQPTSGELLVRMVKRPFGGGRVPLALEVIEADQLADNYSVGRGEGTNMIKMGVEMDAWNRPVAYWLYPRHPGDFMFSGQPATNRLLRVPAEEVLHLYLCEDRPIMTRGVPGFHTALKRLNNMGGYEEAEIVAARASACIMGFIQSPDSDALATDGIQDGERVSNLGAGEIKELAPGEIFNGFSPNRPNSAMEPFMRFMLRGMAAGVGVSYESVSRDYSQSNYSSSRLALLDDRDSWRVLQDWLIADLCQPVFETWLEMAVLSGELTLPSYDVDAEAYQSCRWLARGWSYIDPLKEAMADKMRVRCGFSTVADVVAAQGGDYEDVFRQRRRELDLASDYQLVLETDPAQVNDKGQAQPLPAEQETDTGIPAEDASKTIEKLFEEMQAALDLNQDELAATILDRIDAVEKLAGRSIVLQIDNHLPELAPSFEATMPAREPVNKTITVQRADGSTFTAKVKEE